MERGKTVLYSTMDIVEGFFSSPPPEYSLILINGLLGRVRRYLDVTRVSLCT